MGSFVTNVDGDYYADDPRDFCVHGVYVGGCGYDFMCGACEGGDPDPSPRDLQVALGEVRERGSQVIREMVDLSLRIAMEKGLTYASCRIIERSWPSSFLASEERTERSLHAQLLEARRWAKDKDDHKWMYTRRQAQVEGFMRHQMEERQAREEERENQQ